MLKLIAIAVVVLVAGVLALATTKPDNFRVERSTLIQAPAKRIYPLIKDLQAFGTWSPYEKKDPAMRRTFSGAPSGKGAAYDWEGNSQVGKGHLEITDSVPPARVAMRLDMLEPIEGHNTVLFTLEPQGGSTKVTWAIQGPMPFISKVIGVFVDMDRMVGTDFEAGLSDLKAIAEK